MSTNLGTKLKRLQIRASSYSASENATTCVQAES